jgi:uncharacterized membrane protein YdjX (TVP38/TMEM64 family)
LEYASAPLPLFLLQEILESRSFIRFSIRKTITKYEKWTGSDSKFTKWFAIAIFLPVAPDDFLCYLAGTTRMGWKKFTTIILWASRLQSLCTALACIQVCSMSLL